jgi:arylformamidase
MKFFDVSVPIKSGMLHWPGDPDVDIYKINSFRSGDGVNISGINFGLHSGTHMDAPLHFIDKADDIASISPEILIGPARVIHINNPEFIGVEELKEKIIRSEERILFRTKNSDEEWYNKDFTTNYVYLNNDAAKYLASKKIKIVGIDYLSIGEFKKGKTTHQILLGNNIWIIEGLYLKEVPEGEYEMYALPLKISGADGSPVRVILKM